MAGNTMDRTTYMLLYWALQSAFGAYFKSTLFAPLISPISNTSLSVKESLTVLLLLLLVFPGMALLAAWKRNRNLFHLFIGIFLPYCLYLVLEMYPYVPKWIIVYGCCCLAGILFCGVCIARRPIAEGANKQRIVKARCKRFGHSAYIVAGFFSLVLTVLFLAANLLGLSLGGIGKYAAYNFQRDSEACISCHEVELELLHEEKWQTASQSEKVQCLEVVIQIETAYLGLSHEVALNVEKIGGDVLGSYNEYFQEITVDSEHLLKDPARECLDTMLHEMYHGYQHDLCEVYDEVSQKYRNMLNLRQASNYTYEFTKYVHGDDDIMGYATQEIEVDAQKYAKERAEKYIDYLDLDLDPGLAP